MRYDFKTIEEKWQKRWEAEGTFRASNDTSKPKFYGLVEFPYPSGVGMHVGHIKAYSGLEVIWKDIMYFFRLALTHLGYQRRTMRLKQGFIRVKLPPETSRNSRAS